RTGPGRRHRLRAAMTGPRSEVGAIPWGLALAGSARADDLTGAVEMVDELGALTGDEVDLGREVDVQVAAAELHAVGPARSQEGWDRGVAVGVGPVDPQVGPRDRPDRHRAEARSPGRRSLPLIAVDRGHAPGRRLRPVAGGFQLGEDLGRVVLLKSSGESMGATTGTVAGRAVALSFEVAAAAAPSPRAALALAGCVAAAVVVAFPTPGGFERRAANIRTRAAPSATAPPPIPIFRARVPTTV